MDDSEIDLLETVRIGEEPLQKLPEDLYIPPDALLLVLETFEGPMDLLLYLIRKQNLDILNIPIAEITAQYMEYVEMMRTLNLELAAEYLVMAAMLAEIKSRMLLPVRASEEEEEDPRAELVRRLQEYEKLKADAEVLDQLPRVGREWFPVEAEVTDRPAPPLPQVDLQALFLAFQDVLKRAEQFQHHQVKREPLSIRERMTRVLDQLRNAKFVEFYRCFQPEEGRAGVVITLMAILELLKESLVSIIQNRPFGNLYVCAPNQSEAEFSDVA